MIQRTGHGYKVITGNKEFGYFTTELGAKTWEEREYASSNGERNQSTSCQDSENKDSAQS